MFVKFAVLFCFVAIASAAIDWCEVEDAVCGGKSHVACNHSGKFSPTCVKPVQIPMTAEIKALILDTHNEYRNKAAAGLPNLNRKAAAMNTLIWSNELQKMATLNSKQCDMDHDECRNTETFKRSGQNLAWKASPNPFTAIIKDQIVDSIGKWFNEYLNAEVRDIDSYSRAAGKNGKLIGHFTCLVKDITTHVGCGAITYMEGTSNNFYLVCNYGNTNLLKSPTFVSGPIASQCPGETNPEYSNLCAAIE